EQRKRGYFRAQPIPARAFVTAAGPLSNFIFAIFAFSTIMLVQGRDVTDYAHLADRIPARIMQVTNAPAITAGLKPGDVITAVDGQPVANFAALQSIVLTSVGKPLTLAVRRGDQMLTIVATPARRPANVDHPGQGMLGINGPQVLPSEQTIVRVSP